VKGELKREGEIPWGEGKCFTKKPSMRWEKVSGLPVEIVPLKKGKTCVNKN